MELDFLERKKVSVKGKITRNVQFYPAEKGKTFTEHKYLEYLKLKAYLSLAED